RRPERPAVRRHLPVGRADGCVRPDDAARDRPLHLPPALYGRRPHRGRRHGLVSRGGGVTLPSRIAAGPLRYAAATSRIRDLGRHALPDARAAIPQMSCATGRNTPPKPTAAVRAQWLRHGRILRGPNASTVGSSGGARPVGLSLSAFVSAQWRGPGKMERVARGQDTVAIVLGIILEATQF